MESWCNIDFDGSYANPCKGNDAVLYLNGEKLTSLVIPDNVTSIGSNAFSDCTGLTTVTIPNSVTYIGSGAFYNCENLKKVNITDLKSWCEISFGIGPQNTSGQPNANPFESSDADLYVNGEKITDLIIPETVTKINHRAFNGCSNSFSADNAFSGNSDKINFVVINVNKDAVKFSSDNSIPTVIFEIKDQTIRFNNNILIYSDLEYNYLSEIVEKYSSAKEIYFKSLEFDGLKPDIIVIEDCENIDVSAQNFTLNDLYVIIQVLKNDESETVSFARMFELLESGDYDAFKIVINHGGEVIEKNIFQKIADFFEGISTNALRVIKRAVNFVASIFRKK